MSHFCVYVFGDHIDTALEPYDENIDFPAYVDLTKQEAIEKVRKDIEGYKNEVYDEYLKDPDEYGKKHDNAEHIRYLKKEFPKRLQWTDEECYDYAKSWYPDEMVSENGDLLSTYNPNSKWDWWIVGGRWNNSIIKKNDEMTNSCQIKDINFEATRVPFAFIDLDGEWNEVGHMGWWGISTGEMPQEEWKKMFSNYVDSLPLDVYMTVIDCHI